MLFFFINFFINIMFEIFLTEKRFYLRKLEGNSFGDGLGCVSTIEYILLCHFSEKVYRGWCKILNLVDKHVIKAFISISIEHEFLKNVVDYIHHIVTLVVDFIVLVILKKVINIHFFFLVQE